MRNVLGIILGGGQGTRLYPLTKLRAKPAVPIAGKYRLIDIPVSNCINSGVQKIYVLTQFNSASLNRHLSLTYHFGPFSEGFVEVLAAQQTLDNMGWFQGTADAVRQCMRYIQSYNISEYLVLSGDHLYRMDYRKFIEYHRENDADLTIPVIAVEEERASSFGLLKTDAENRIIEFREKPKGDALKEMAVDTRPLGLSDDEAKRKPYLASMGIYAFRSDVLRHLLTRDPNQKDFGKEIIPTAIHELKVKAYLFKGYWEDIGTIRSFYNANMALLRYPNPPFSFFDENAPIYTRQRFLPPIRLINADIVESMIGEGSIITNAKIRRSLLGIRTIVGDSVQIEDTLIMGCDYYDSSGRQEMSNGNDAIPLGIGRGSVIKKAIIDKNARIGKNVRIENRDQIEFDDSHEQEGWYIRDGIVIILKDAVIPDGTVI
ncbi:MAG: glucose-1-phosphate adenylyltransferase [candidate division KSB1 bacterium]|nr:glucose-1-phosphate adenylyltransferase [candidate division KSB1 bacterium]